VTTLAIVHEPWMRDRACGSGDTALFFPPRYEQAPERAVREAKAKAICAGCPVRLDCLEFARRTADDHAIMGGLTPEERRLRCLNCGRGVPQQGCRHGYCSGTCYQALLEVRG